MRGVWTAAANRAITTYSSQEKWAEPSDRRFKEILAEAANGAGNKTKSGRFLQTYKSVSTNKNREDFCFQSYFDLEITCFFLIFHEIVKLLCNITDIAQIIRHVSQIFYFDFARIVGHNAPSHAPRCKCRILGQAFDSTH